MRSKALPLAVGVLCCLSAGASNAASERLTVRLSGLRNDDGQAGCMIFTSPDGFPATPAKSLKQQFVKIKGKSATCTFDDVKPGTYAVVSMHDENGNGKMDSNILGMPLEGWGTSRDSRGTFGPKFKDAVFTFSGSATPVKVSIHY